MTKTLYAATSKYVEEINNLPVKRQVSVSGILKKLDVSRSGYNAWKKRVPSDTSIRRTVLKEKIQKIYDDSHQNYGAPKIAAELRKSGENIAEKTVGNYMRQMGIKAQWIKARARKALMDAGFGDRLAAMPKGLDTMLYKDFAEDGVEVSGGEAQKIAIARALYKDAPFIILDEPTAALDPIAEAEIYEKFNAISGDRTAIYISHRLSSCRFCDEIAVFSDGRVIQQGTHETLLAQETGKYAELWHAQAQYYTKQTPDAAEN